MYIIFLADTFVAV